MYDYYYIAVVVPRPRARCVKRQAVKQVTPTGNNNFALTDGEVEPPEAPLAAAPVERVTAPVRSPAADRTDTSPPTVATLAPETATRSASVDIALSAISA